MFHRREATLPLFFLAAALLLQAPFGPAEAKSKRKEKKEAEIRAPFAPSGKWEAFLKGEKGEQYALQQPVEKNFDEHWLGLEFTDWEGPRFRMAVMKVENKVEMGSVEVVYEDEDEARKAQETVNRAAIPLGSLEGLVTSSMFNTGRFELIERKQIDTVLAELKFNSTDLVSAPSASKVGRLLGAQYMLFVEVAEYSDPKNFMNTIGFAKKNAQAALTFRVLEVATGRIFYSSTFRGEAGSWGLTLPFWSQGDTSPIHYALTVSVNKAAYDLANFLKDQPWVGAVAKVDGDIVTLNAGATQGMKAGTTLVVYSKGEELLDPNTGASLGTDDEVIGSVQITTVRETLSKATVIEGCRGVKVGDRVELQKDGEVLKIAQKPKPAPAAPGKPAAPAKPAPAPVKKNGG
jgi:hypothetical protein